MFHMNEIEISKKILLKVVNEGVPFAMVLKTCFKKYDLEPLQKANITALVGCELRHQYLFDNLLSRYLEESEFEKTVYLRFLLANHMFLRRYEEAKLYEHAKEDVEESKIKEILDFINSTDEIIPTNLDKASPEFLSLRYNTPAWVIRMWQKQYGKGIVFKTLKVNYRQSTPSVRLNPNKINVDEFLSKHPDYVKAPVEDMVLYQGRGNAKGLEEFKDGSAFFMKMGTKHVLDKIDLDPLKGIAVFCEVPNNVIQDLAVRFGKDMHLDLVVNHTTLYNELKRFLEHRNLTHSFIYECEVTGLITCLSKKVHTFLCMPKNTTFDLFRSTPDYFLRVDQDKLDEIITQELVSLEECSKFIEDGGELVYMIPTLSRKESNNVIAKFLVNHPDFTLVEEQQLFPFEVYDSCLYFARLQKVETESD